MGFSFLLSLRFHMVLILLCSVLRQPRALSLTPIKGRVLACYSCVGLRAPFVCSCPQEACLPVPCMRVSPRAVDQHGSQIMSGAANTGTHKGPSPPTIWPSVFLLYRMETLKAAFPGTCCRGQSRGPGAASWVQIRSPSLLIVLGESLHFHPSFPKVHRPHDQVE